MVFSIRVTQDWQSSGCLILIFRIPPSNDHLGRNLLWRIIETNSLHPFSTAGIVSKRLAEGSSCSPPSSTSVCIHEKRLHFNLSRSALSPAMNESFPASPVAILRIRRSASCGRGRRVRFLFSFPYCHGGKPELNNGGHDCGSSCDQNANQIWIHGTSFGSRDLEEMVRAIVF